MSTVHTPKATYPGGTTTTLPLFGNADYSITQVDFSGRATGIVTVSFRGANSSIWTAITGGAINLATLGTLVLAGVSVAELKFVDAGTGEYNVDVIQRN